MKVKIGTQEYYVEEVDKISSGDGILSFILDFFGNNYIVGQIWLDSKRILIKNGRTKREKIKAYYHELSHGILNEMKKKYDKFDECNENQTQYLADILIKLFKPKCK